MKTVCARYASNFSDADDILQEGFVKIFMQIDKFSYAGKGSFSAWMRRIMINTAINFYRKRKHKLSEVQIEDRQLMIVEDDQDEDIISLLIDAGFSKEKLVEFLQKVSQTNRIVFNLFVIEEYKHKEISQILNIEERTSRIRLMRARKELQIIIAEAYRTQLKNKSVLYYG